MDRNFWKTHYVLTTDAGEIERHVKRTHFSSDGAEFEMIYFEKDRNAPNILISEGSGGHAYIFAELGYLMHQRGYNVFIMPRHGGVLIRALVRRHRDALAHIATHFDDRIGVFAEGLGGFAVFYLTLTEHPPLKSVVYQNSPALIDDPEWRAVALQGKGFLFALGRLLAWLVPNIPFPISAYLNWKALIDSKRENHEIEDRLVRKGYLKDPDFDRTYPISAVMSLVINPPPGSVAQMKTPTLFMVASRGFGGEAYISYLKRLYDKIVLARKKLISVDGSVYWMLSHPKEAAEVICGWFNETMPGAGESRSL